MPSLFISSLYFKCMLKLSSLISCSDTFKSPHTFAQVIQLRAHHSYYNSVSLSPDYLVRNLRQTCQFTISRLLLLPCHEISTSSSSSSSSHSQRFLFLFICLSSIAWHVSPVNMSPHYLLTRSNTS